MKRIRLSAVSIDGDREVTEAIETDYGYEVQRTRESAAGAISVESFGLTWHELGRLVKAIMLRNAVPGVRR